MAQMLYTNDGRQIYERLVLPLHKQHVSAMVSSYCKRACAHHQLRATTPGCAYVHPGRPGDKSG